MKRINFAVLASIFMVFFGEFTLSKGAHGRSIDRDKSQGEAQGSTNPEAAELTDKRVSSKNEYSMKRIQAKKSLLNGVSYLEAFPNKRRLTKFNSNKIASGKIQSTKILGSQLVSEKTDANENSFSRTMSLADSDSAMESSDELALKAKKRLKKSHIKKMQENTNETKAPLELGPKFRPLLVLSSSISVIDHKIAPRPRLAVSSALVGVRAEQENIYGDLQGIVSTTGSYLRTAYFGSNLNSNLKFQMGRMGIGGAESLSTNGVDGPTNVGILDGVTLFSSGDFLGGKTALSLGVANGIRGELGATDLSGVTSKSLANFLTFSQGVSWFRIAGALGNDKNHVSQADVASTSINEARVRDMAFFESSVTGDWKPFQVTYSHRDEVMSEESPLNGTVPSEGQKSLDSDRRIITNNIGLNLSLDRWSEDRSSVSKHVFSMGFSMSKKLNNGSSDSLMTTMAGTELRYRYLGLNFELAGGTMKETTSQSTSFGRFATFTATCVLAN